MRVTVQVEVGAGPGRVVLSGRAVQALEARHALGEHARCRFTFDRGAVAAAGAGQAPPVGVRTLLGAPVRVVVSRVGGDADGARSGAWVAFEGTAHRVREVHRPNRGSRFVVLARSASAALGERRRQRRYPAHPVRALAEALGVRAAEVPAAQGEALSYVQEGESDWQFLARLAAEEGLLLRPTWAWGGPATGGPSADEESDDGGAPDDGAEGRGAQDGLPAELRAGFAARAHAVTWGVDLLALATDARPALPAVSGAHYDADEKHDHRYRGVRARPTWTGGAADAVAAVERAARAAAGADAEAGLAPAGVRAPTLARFRTRLERAGERRVGSAVAVTGRATAPGLVAGDRLTVRTADDAAAAGPEAAGRDGAPDGAAPAWQLDTAGTYGLVAVVHRWDGAQYEAAFAATPWAGYHAPPPGADAAERLAPSGQALSALLDATPALGRAVHGAAYGGVGAGVGAFGGRLAGQPLTSQHLLHGDDRAGTDAALLALAAGEHDAAGDADQGLAAGAGHAAGLPTGLAGGAGLRLALGLVVDNADPSGQGRVRVRLLWQDGDERAAWARVASVMAGNRRGLGSLPEVGDEVVCGFLAGDPERPVILGSLWNGKDRAAHTPLVRHWVTRAGNAVVLDDAEAQERVELHTPEGRTMVQLTSSGPGGGPLVTVHSKGDVAIEAPDGAVRIAAKQLLVHTTEDVGVDAGSTITHRAQGAVTVASGAGLGLSAAAEIKVAAGGALTAHAGGVQQRTGSQVRVNPPGASVPRVTAQVPAAGASAWAPRLVPTPGPGRSTEDPKAHVRSVLVLPARRAWVATQLLLDGNPAPNVSLRLEFSSGGARNVTTDSAGVIYLDGLRPGGATVTASAGDWPPPPVYDTAYDPDPEGLDVDENKDDAEQPSTGWSAEAP